jgi:hypothetical protein
MCTVKTLQRPKGQGGLFTPQRYEKCEAHRLRSSFLCCSTVAPAILREADDTAKSQRTIVFERQTGSCESPVKTPPPHGIGVRNE